MLIIYIPIYILMQKRAIENSIRKFMEIGQKDMNSRNVYSKCWFLYRIGTLRNSVK